MVNKALLPAGMTVYLSNHADARAAGLSWWSARRKLPGGGRRPKGKEFTAEEKAAMRDSFASDVRQGFVTSLRAAAAARAVPAAPPGAGRLLLQLVPLDEDVAQRMAEGGHNPLLELTFRPRKPLASLLNFLRSKWAAAAAHRPTDPASAGLQLHGTALGGQPLLWDAGSPPTTAQDMHAALGRPSCFRLQYTFLGRLAGPVGATDPAAPHRLHNGLQTSTAQTGALVSGPFAVPQTPASLHAALASTPLTGAFGTASALAAASAAPGSRPGPASRPPAARVGTSPRATSCTAERAALQSSPLRNAWQLPPRWPEEHGLGSVEVRNPSPVNLQSAPHQAFESPGFAASFGEPGAGSSALPPDEATNWGAILNNFGSTDAEAVQDGGGFGMGICGPAKLFPRHEVGELVSGQAADPQCNLPPQHASEGRATGLLPAHSFGVKSPTAPLGMVSTAEPAAAAGCSAPAFGDLFGSDSMIDAILGCPAATGNLLTLSPPSSLLSLSDPFPAPCRGRKLYRLAYGYGDRPGPGLAARGTQLGGATSTFDCGTGCAASGSPTKS